MKFTFAPNEIHNEITVIAFNEDEARHNAMAERWGLPCPYGYDKYQGKGLVLCKIED